jgi:cephalosporin-C deacetylase-like acetyl esterase
VVSVDVRGKGELDVARGAATRVTEYDAIQWQRDGFAISYAGAGRTMMGARALDLIRVMDALDGEAGAGQSYELIGEGLGGTWVLAAAAADPRVDRVTAIGTLSSWARLIETKWNALRDYFWVPRALDTFDLSDLPALAHGEVWIVNPVDAMLHPLSAGDAAADFAWAQSWCGERLALQCAE